MRKILSVITAAAISALQIMPACAANNKKTITADEVKEFIYSSGLKEYPDLWDMAVSEAGAVEDVSNKKTVKEVIDVTNSYREFYVKKPSGDTASDKYSVNDGDDIALIFNGFNINDTRVQLTVFTQNYILEESAGTALYSLIHDYEPGLGEDYEKIAEIINESGIDEVKDIRIVNSVSEYLPGTCIYIKDANDMEYAVSVFGYTKTAMNNLSDEVKSIEKGKLMDFNDWCSAIEESGEEVKKEFPPLEKTGGDEIRVTDTRAAYIGTESVFSDVSGDLVSYVNELYDLGIINGYEGNVFMPENNITRAEAASMLARMLQYSAEYGGEFDDVNADDWFAGDVSALVAAGVINGYSETEFAPYENIKYQEVMKILVCALGYGNYFFKGFGDSAYPSMTNQEAMRIGLTDNLKSFDTTAPITRADMAVMLSNALDTPLFTAVERKSSNGTVAGVMGRDITLIDYLNGKKLNGSLPKTDIN